MIKYLLSIGVLAFAVLLFCLAFCSCSLISKQQPSDEMEKLTETVLKKNEGIDIEVKPIPRVMGK